MSAGSIISSIPTLSGNERLIITDRLPADTLSGLASCHAPTTWRTALTAGVAPPVPWVQPEDWKGDCRCTGSELFLFWVSRKRVYRVGMAQHGKE